VKLSWVLLNFFRIGEIEPKRVGSEAVCIG